MVFGFPVWLYFQSPFCVQGKEYAISTYKNGPLERTFSVLPENEYLLEYGSLFKRGNVPLFALFPFLDSGFETVSQSEKKRHPGSRIGVRDRPRCGIQKFTKTWRFPGFRISLASPRSSGMTLFSDGSTVSKQAILHFVIPDKPCETGRDPGSRDSRKKKPNPHPTP